MPISEGQRRRLREMDLEATTWQEVPSTTLRMATVVGVAGSKVTISVVAQGEEITAHTAVAGLAVGNAVIVVMGGNALAVVLCKA